MKIIASYMDSGDRISVEYNDVILADDQSASDYARAQLADDGVSSPSLLSVECFEPLA